MNPGHPRPATHRAFTLLEVILSLVMLTGVATSIMSAIAYVERADARDRRRLAAHEVANRIVLQWLNDEKQVPDPQLPIAYGDRHQVFFELSITPVTMVLNDRQASSETQLQGLDRYRVVAVRVFDAMDIEQASQSPVKGEELAVVWRMYDPAAARNPDQITTLGDDPENIRKLLDNILNGFTDARWTSGGRSPLEREGGRLR